MSSNDKFLKSQRTDFSKKDKFLNLPKDKLNWKPDISIVTPWAMAVEDAEDLELAARGRWRTSARCVSGSTALPRSGRAAKECDAKGLSRERLDGPASDASGEI